MKKSSPAKNKKSPDSLLMDTARHLTDLYFQHKEYSVFKRTLDECMANENQKINELASVYSSYSQMNNIKFLNGSYFKDYEYFERFQEIPGKYHSINNANYFFISHRWLTTINPDPNGEQFAIIREFVNQLPPEIQDTWGFWYDYSCIPQKDKSGNLKPGEKTVYNKALKMMHILPLLSHTIMLYDVQYLNRAWCSMEWMCASKLTPISAGDDSLLPFGNIIKFRHLAILILYLTSDDKFKESFMSGEDTVAVSRLNRLVYKSINSCLSTIENDKNILTALMYEHFENHLRVLGLRTQVMIASLILETLDEKTIKYLFAQFLVISEDVELKWTNESMFVLESLFNGETPTDMIFHRGKVTTKSNSSFDKRKK